VLGALQWFVLSYGMAILGYLAINAIASRWLGLADFTDFILVLTVSTVAGQLALVGAHRGGLREAAVMEAGDERALRILRAGARGATRVTLPAAGLLCAGLTFALTDGTQGHRLVLSLGFGALVVLSGLQKLWANYLRGFGAVRLASLLEGRSGGGIVSITQAALLAVAWIAFPGSGLAGAVVALAVGFALPVMYSGAQASRHWRHLPADGHLWADLREMVSRNWRFAANQLALYLGGNLELWIAGLLLVDTQASLFSASQRLALLVAIPLTSVQVVFAPVSARLLAAGDNERLQRVLRTGATLAAVSSAVLWGPMLIAPEFVLGVVFGQKFEAGGTALSILTIGVAANVLTGLCQTALTMSRHEGLVAAVTGTGVVCQIVLGTIAALVWGFEGLAVSAATIATTVYTIQWASARRLLGIWTHPTTRPSLALLRRTSS
jgi:O-antigen/teichoic acid export membrane protein